MDFGARVAGFSAANGVAVAGDDQEASGRLAEKRRIALDELGTGQWSAHEWLFFLRALPEELDCAMLTELDATYHFTQAKNAEILQQWLLMAVRCHYTPAYPHLEEVSGHGWPQNPDQAAVRETNEDR